MRFNLQTQDCNNPQNTISISNYHDAWDYLVSQTHVYQWDQNNLVSNGMQINNCLAINPKNYLGVYITQGSSGSLILNNAAANQYLLTGQTNFTGFFADSSNIFNLSYHEIPVAHRINYLGKATMIGFMVKSIDDSSLEATSLKLGLPEQSSQFSVWNNIFDGTVQNNAKVIFPMGAANWWSIPSTDTEQNAPLIEAINELFFIQDEHDDDDNLIPILIKHITAILNSFGSKAISILIDALRHDNHRTEENLVEFLEVLGELDDKTSENVRREFLEENLFSENPARRLGAAYAFSWLKLPCDLEKLEQAKKVEKVKTIRTTLEVLSIRLATKNAKVSS